MVLRRITAVGCFIAVPPGTGGGPTQQEFVDNWFVTKDGSGAKTGSSWNNALSFSDFLSMISNTTTGLEDAGIHIQEGTYIVPKGAGKFLTISKDILCIRGGYSKELTYDELEGCDPEAYPTIFTGDVNGDGTPDEGDGAFAYLTGGVVRFENITFRNFYKSNSLDKETEGKNKHLKSIAEDTASVARILESKGVATTFEWTEGTHFGPLIPRLDMALSQLVQQL